jgi:hypothetical protein
MTQHWEAGREADAEIARAVFGKSVRMVYRSREIGQDFFQWDDGVQFGGEWVPPYSTDIAAAWTIIEQVGTLIFSRRQRFFAALAIMARTSSGEFIAWPAALFLFGRPDSGLPPFPLAICRAALLAVGDTA